MKNKNLVDKKGFAVPYHYHPAYKTFKSKMQLSPLQYR